MMVKLCFAASLIDVVMNCVSSVSYSFLVNGEITCYVSPTWGPRQGDSLSPYLFLICAEGLTCLIMKYKQSGLIYGVSICRNALRITHLLFTDGSFLFLRASFQECRRLKTILHTYEIASEQCVNL